MTASRMVESEIEEAALIWLEFLSYRILNSADIAPGELAAERDTYEQVVLASRLRVALERLNPDLPAEAIFDQNDGNRREHRQHQRRQLCSRKRRADRTLDAHLGDVGVLAAGL